MKTEQDPARIANPAEEREIDLKRIDEIIDRSWGIRFAAWQTPEMEAELGRLNAELEALRGKYADDGEL